uniref:Uncharacterized protein n=1 Tax=Cannabis sativa TaxID=3483 RepID=A0A803Q8C7_CANSA
MSSNDQVSSLARIRESTLSTTQIQITQGNPSLQMANVKSPLEDPTNSYYFHHRDNPGVKKFQEHHHMEYIIFILMGLSNPFSQVHGSILLMDPLPKVNRVLHLVTEEENQKRNSSAIPNPNANMAFAFHGNKGGTNKPDQQGTKTNQPKRNKPFFTHCNILGHTIERYFKIHGYPPDFNKNKPKKVVANQV